MADEKRERRPQRRQVEDDGLIKKLIEVNRVTKVVKGGKNMRFAALVIVGDGKGKIGVATGKAKEVPEAFFESKEEHGFCCNRRQHHSPYGSRSFWPRCSFDDARFRRYRRYRGWSRSCGNGSSRY